MRGLGFFRYKMDDLIYSAWVKVTEGKVNLLVDFSGFESVESAEEFLAEFLGEDNKPKVVH